MKTLKKALESQTPTFAVFIHLGGQNAAVVKLQADAIKKRMAGKAEIVTVDTSFDKPLADKYNIKDYPTWIVFVDGKETARAEGMQSDDDLVALFEKALG